MQAARTSSASEAAHPPSPPSYSYVEVNEEKTMTTKKSTKRAGHVTFSPSVIARPSSSRVTVVEHPGVYVDALGRAVSVPAQSSFDGSDDAGATGAGAGGGELPTCVVAAGRERISKSGGNILNADNSRSDARDSSSSSSEKGISFAVEDTRSSHNRGNDDGTSSVSTRNGNDGVSNATADGDEDVPVQYDTLTINLGLLKCGYRYETVVPVHAPVGVGDLDSNGSGEQEYEYGGGNGRLLTIAKIGESMDTDLEAEATSCPPLHCGDGTESSFDTRPTSNSKSSSTQQHDNDDHLRIRLAARRPGRYQSTFSVVLLEHTSEREDGGVAKIKKMKHIVSVQINATQLGKDQGKPQLKSNVVKLGKLVGYDSDEETEWRGFDASDDDDEEEEGDGDDDEEDEGDGFYK